MAATREDYLSKRYFQLVRGKDVYRINYDHRYLGGRLLGVAIGIPGKSRSQIAKELMMARNSLRHSAKHTANRIFPAAEYIHVDIALE